VRRRSRKGTASISRRLRTRSISKTSSLSGNGVVSYRPARRSHRPTPRQRRPCSLTAAFRQQPRPARGRPRTERRLFLTAVTTTSTTHATSSDASRASACPASAATTSGAFNCCASSTCDRCQNPSMDGSGGGTYQLPRVRASTIAGTGSISTARSSASPAWQSASALTSARPPSPWGCALPGAAATCAPGPAPTPPCCWLSNRARTWTAGAPPKLDHHRADQAARHDVAQADPAELHAAAALLAATKDPTLVEDQPDVPAPALAAASWSGSARPPASSTCGELAGRRSGPGAVGPARYCAEPAQPARVEFPGRRRRRRMRIGARQRRCRAGPGVPGARGRRGLAALGLDAGRLAIDR
jgi:hypothetical protein